MNTYTIAVTYVVQVQAPDNETAILEAMEKTEKGEYLDLEVEIKGRKAIKP
jgi:putative lipoic acid-binding regulatory protein